MIRDSGRSKLRVKLPFKRYQDLGDRITNHSGSTSARLRAGLRLAICEKSLCGHRAPASKTTRKTSLIKRALQLDYNCDGNSSCSDLQSVNVA